MKGSHVTCREVREEDEQPGGGTTGGACGPRACVVMRSVVRGGVNACQFGAHPEQTTWRCVRRPGTNTARCFF